MWAAAFDTVHFSEAVSWFRRRAPITDEEFATAAQNARAQAFWISGVTHADVIRQVHESLGKALEQGVPFEQWKAEIAGTLKSAWGSYLDPANQPDRIETILRNWAESSYNRARWQQMGEPAIVRLRPYRMFDAVRDGRTSEICTACNGTILPADDTWWDEHHPPLHHRCRSGIRALTPEKANRLGITSRPTSTEAQAGFGSLQEWQGPNPKKYPAKAKPPKPPPAPKPAPKHEPSAQPMADKVRLARALELKDGGAEMRSLVREQVQHSLPGAVSRDLHDFDAVGVEQRRPKAAILNVDEARCRAYSANGFHGWDGEIVVDSIIHKRAQQAVQLIGRSEINDAERYLAHNLRTFVHEELHGHSRTKPYAYNGPGKILEEMSVELHCRRIVYDLIPGLAKARPYYDGDGAFGSYENYVAPVRRAVMAAGKLTQEAAAQSIERASARMFGPGRQLWTHDQVLDEWAAGLGLDAGATEQVKGAIRAMTP